MWAKRALRRRVVASFCNLVSWVWYNCKCNVGVNLMILDLLTVSQNSSRKDDFVVWAQHYTFSYFLFRILFGSRLYLYNKVPT